MAQLQPTDVDGTLTSLVTENIKTANHTLEIADTGKVVAFNGTAAQTVTVPNDNSVNFPIGSIVYINRINSGTVTLAAASGVTVSRTGTFGSYEEIYIRKRAANFWVTVDSARTLSATGGAEASLGAYDYHTFTSGSGTLTLS